jgi:NTP pyrophosphatase (non-canonical NTP hydrolase)
MHLNTLAEQIRVDNRNNGFDFDVNDVAQVGAKLMLAVGELAEAYEEIRDRKGVNFIYHEQDTLNSLYVADVADNVKLEGFPVEIADCIIRLLQICGEANIDIQGVIMQKLAYNRTRAYQHGGKVI